MKKSLTGRSPGLRTGNPVAERTKMKIEYERKEDSVWEC